MATKISDMTAGAVADMDKDQTGFESSINLSTVPLTRRLTAGTIAQWLRQIGFGIAVAAVSPAAVTLGFNSGSGVDNAAGNVTFVAPLSTGAATPATMGFQIGLAGVSGAGVQTTHTSALYTPNGIIFGVDSAPASARAALETQGPNKIIAYGDSVNGRARYTQVTIANANFIDMYSAGGTVAVPTAPGNSVQLGGTAGGSFEGGVWYGQRVNYILATAEAWGVGAHGTQVQFTTTQNGTDVQSVVAIIGNDGGLTLNGKTITVSSPILNASQTWNNGAVTFTGIKLNVTDTASAAASLLADLQVGGVSKFSVQKDGAVTAAGASVFSSSLQVNSTLLLPTTGLVTWGAAAANGDFAQIADGVTRFRASSGNGFAVKATTDAVMQLRTKTDGAFATLDLLGLKASGVAGATGTSSAGVGTVTVVNGIVTAIT